MNLPVPVESWTEIFKWLEGPKQNLSISLVNRRFHEIIFLNLAKKYEKEEHWKRAPDLRFCREWGAAALREQNEPNRRLPIAEVPPPQYIKPFSRVFVHHFDDQVLAFFYAIGHWLQNDILLNVEFRPLDAPAHHYPGPFHQLMRTADFGKFQMFARQILLGHCSGFNRREYYCDDQTHQPIGYLFDEEFVLSIPRIRNIVFEDSFMIRWLFTPTVDGAQRIWILWTFRPEMKHQIEQEFANATMAQKFIIIFRPINESTSTMRNQRTQECLHYLPTSLVDGCWECILRQPIGEAVPNGEELDAAYRKMLLRGFTSNGPSINVMAPTCGGGSHRE